MEISKEQIEEYKQLYKEDFEEELTDSEAIEIIYGLVALYEVLTKPLPEEVDLRKASRDV